jgi:hypothetical protein
LPRGYPWPPGIPPPDHVVETVAEAAALLAAATG